MLFGVGRGNLNLDFSFEGTKENWEDFPPSTTFFILVILFFGLFKV